MPLAILTSTSAEAECPEFLDQDTRATRSPPGKRQKALCSLETGLTGLDEIAIDGADGPDAQLSGGSRTYTTAAGARAAALRCDVRALAAIARAAGAVSIIDNSWATPILQRPIGLGIDMVVHSASKYLGGHSDVVAGVIAGSTARIGNVRSTVTPYIGPKLSPFEGWLLVRSLRTLAVRLERQGRTAAVIARQLAEHPAVARVHLPGVTSPGGPGLDGNSGLLAFEAADGLAVERFCDALQVFKLGVSWGGHESLVCPALVTLEQAGGPNHARFFGHGPGLVRLSIGLEDPETLWSNLDQAFKQGSET